MGVGCSFRSRKGFANVPGQSSWYDGPSKSPSSSRHPMMGTTALKSAPFRQAWSSSSSVVSAPPGSVQVPFASIASQYSQWPISSDADTFVVCADHIGPGFEAGENIGGGADG